MWGVRKIAEGVWQVQAVASSVYILAGRDGTVTLWDAGAIGSAGRVLAVLGQLGYTPDRLQTVALSHHHVDHSGGLARLVALTGVQTAAHALDIPAISEPPRGLARLGAFQTVAHAGWLFARSRRVRIALALEEGDRLRGVEQFRVIHTPGHTAGSISLYDEARGLLIVGDALQHRWGILSPPARLFTADMAEAHRSIRKLAALDVRTLAFAHFPPITENAGTRLRALAERLGDGPDGPRRPAAEPALTE